MKTKGLLVVLVICSWILSACQPAQIPPTVTATAAPPTLTFTPALPTETSTPVFTPTITPLPNEFIDAKGIKMGLVSAGTFTMGSEIKDNEKPVHEVYLDDYYMDIYEVTNAAYKLCVDAGICALPNDKSKYDDSKYADHPVVSVDWNKARTYCEAWRGARLPTEAEWEKAARGTDGRTYPWGEGIDCTKANYSNGFNKFCVEDTSAVGSFETGKSPYGMYDMAGNAWEWVSSLYQPYPYNVDDGRENLTLPGARVLRGGGWFYNDDFVRSAIRNGVVPTEVHDSFGFRCTSSP